MKPLMKYELQAYHDRITEIDHILSQDDCPEDVFNNLMNELDTIDEILKNSLKLIQKKKRRLYIVS